MVTQPDKDQSEAGDVTLPNQSSRFTSSRFLSYNADLPSDSASSRLRVENLHYDLTEEDLDVSQNRASISATKLTRNKDLFNRIGPVLKLSLTYDRAGRSEGVAHVTYESASDAKRAIREFDGANAKGMIDSDIRKHKI